MLARTPFSAICPWAEGIVKHIEVDLGDEISIAAACDSPRSSLGNRGLGALANNAGISPKATDDGRLSATETPIETFPRAQMVNLVAPLILCQNLLEPLKKAGGAIVNVTSVAGAQVHPFAGAAYTVSKARLSTLTRELAFELTCGVTI